MSTISIECHGTPRSNEIRQEFEGKVKTDGRKNPAKKKAAQPELSLK